MIRRKTVEDVRAIVAAVSAETEVPVDVICSRDKSAPALGARRLAMRRARQARAAFQTIADALGLNHSSVARMLDRHREDDDAAAQLRAMVAPFRRPGGAVSPLTPSDYALRAGVMPAEARGRLRKLLQAGVVVSVKATGALDCSIYDLTPAGREVLA